MKKIIIIFFLLLFLAGLSNSTTIGTVRETVREAAFNTVGLSEPTGTYWETARTDFWSDTRVALWSTPRNTEIP